ncbi:S41 family peptidase [Terriglobus aquaticus]|uniref:S41 family peptidase n=1 Tax=Terriglobus aquaticus TaxID=940139 RepID=A0ABW9KGL4_9BACT|nr:S41 family peptidase [Terriglobus aquaticus]
MPKSLKISLLAVSAALLLTVFLGANLSGVHAATGSDKEGAYRQIHVYGEVLQHIQSDYVEEPKMAVVTTGALRGLVETLDSSSSYMPADEYKLYKANVFGKGTLGMTVAKRGYYAVIVSTVNGGPADKAGLNDGDVIESIGDISTHDLSVASIQNKLAGQPGTNVTLFVIRPRHSRPEKMQLTLSDLQPVPVAETFYEQNSILYLKPAIIDRDHVQQIEQKLKAMNRTNTKKVLLDLRDVSTGTEADGLRLANLFIKNGTLATLEGQKFNRQTFTAEPGKSVNSSAPLVAIVNRGTAGPAELVAGALLDSKRADVVGEKTFGQGSELKTFEMPDGSAVILSVAKYHTPAGKKLQDEGVVPNILVAQDMGDQAAAGADDEDEDSTDSQVSNASQTVNASKPSLPQGKQPVIVDEQLNKALDMLKGKNA